MDQHMETRGDVEYSKEDADPASKGMKGLWHWKGKWYMSVAGLLELCL